MPKKNNKPNAFLYFMLQWKQNQEQLGRKFPNGLKDVQSDSVCNNTWKNLSEDEKAYYKTMAKSDKIQSNKVKRTGTGESLRDLERIKIKEKEFHDTMVEYISTLINVAKYHNNIPLLKFYVIHVNFFYSRVLDTNEVEYYPAEIAIAEFSLAKGILRVYHEIINSEIKLGFSNAAREQSLKYHQIPLNPSFGKSNYKNIFRDICKFLEPGKENGKFPPLYTFFSQEEVYLPAKFVLNRLGIADDKPDDYLLLYSFEDLFATLYNAAFEGTASVTFNTIIATIELKKDPFAYELGLECEYHGELKVGLMYCSQSIIKRWIFVLYSFCCNPLGIPMIPRVHKPYGNLTPSKDFELINSSFSSLHLNTSRSTAGISDNNRCINTKIDEHRSTNEINKNLTKIIDHSKINKILKNQELMERPLRPPNSKSAATYYKSSDAETIDYNFPSIGRGKKK